MHNEWQHQPNGARLEFASAWRGRRKDLAGWRSGLSEARWEELMTSTPSNLSQRDTINTRLWLYGNILVALVLDGFNPIVSTLEDFS